MHLPGRSSMNKAQSRGFSLFDSWEVDDELGYERVEQGFTEKNRTTEAIARRPLTAQKGRTLRDLEQAGVSRGGADCRDRLGCTAGRDREQIVKWVLL